MTRLFPRSERTPVIRAVGISFPVLLAVWACSDRLSAPPQESTTPDKPGAFAAAPSPGFLPYGVPVPPGQEITVPPPPIDPKRPVIHNPHPEWNLIGKPGFIPPKRLPPTREGTSGSFPPPGQADRGIALNGQPPGWYGLQQMNDAGLDVILPEPLGGSTVADLYAPTLLPPGPDPQGPCIEITTIHERLSSQYFTHHYVGFWDWCQSPPQGTFIVLMDMSQVDFENSYIRTYNGKPALGVAITYDRGGSYCWWGWL